MTGPSVLVVDDHFEIRYLLSRALAHIGYQVRTASSGAEAMDAIRTAPPDVAVLDVMMPGIGGLDVLAAMRSLSTALPTQVLLYSANDDLDEKRAGIRLGAREYLVKGQIGVDGVLAAVARCSHHAGETPPNQ